MKNLFNRIVHTGDFSIYQSLLLLLGRFSIAATFWLSGQTKVKGLDINFITGQFQLGLPHIKESTYTLFKYEYALPLIPSDWAAVMGTIIEHVFPVLLLIGFLTRPAALVLAFMTLTIEIFVYPLAYPTHGIWLTVLLMLIMFGGGKFSIDGLFKKS